jgi:predicted AlkP superfamily phosphohydrolase/phosphomutase
MPQERVLVFGIDGATFDVIRPAIAAGKLPHLKRLMDEGAWGPLESTIHPITPMAWSSFATGCNAGKHGIFDFSRRSDNKILLNNAANRMRPAIWSYLNASDRTSIVLNVPFTYPIEPINGIMIPGFEAPQPSRDVFHPVEIYDELHRKFGELKFDWTFPVGQKLDIEGYLKHCEQTIRHRGETSLHLLKNHPWEFFMVVFSTPDHIQHVFWRHPDGPEIIRRTYEQVDEYLGRFLEAAGEDVTTVIMSDHGFGPIDRLVYLDNWLSQNGYLGRPRMSLQQQAVRTGKRTLKRLLPVQMRKSLRSRFSDLKGRLENAEHTASIDWSRTRAYSYGMYGNIYINLKGRQPNGIVDPADYDALCEEITARLFDLVDPACGQTVVENVYRKEQIYSGPQIEDAPDLVVHWRDYAYFTKRGIDHGDEIFGDDLMVDASEFPHTGTHRLHGVFILHGPQIKPRPEVDAHITDLAPTILQILGEPLPSDMDGRVLSELLDESLEAPTRRVGDLQPVGAAASAMSADDDASLRERLRSLGYIE